MTNWEYCRIAWITKNIDKGTADVIAGNTETKLTEVSDTVTIATQGTLKYFGTTGEVQKITELSETIAKLGLEGWELVSHAYLGAPLNYEVFHFKRPL